VTLCSVAIPGAIDREKFAIGTCVFGILESLSDLFESLYYLTYRLDQEQWADLAVGIISQSGNAAWAIRKSASGARLIPSNPIYVVGCLQFTNPAH
jgi:hypothetical protein